MSKNNWVNFYGEMWNMNYCYRVRKSWGSFIDFYFLPGTFMRDDVRSVVFSNKGDRNEVYDKYLEHGDLNTLIEDCKRLGAL